jgi:hypothetical protein
MVGFHIKNISFQVDLICNLLDIPVYKYVLFNSSCKKLVKEYFTFKSENKFIYINFINTHQSLYFKSFYPKSVKIILFKMRIMSSFKDFPFEYLPSFYLKSVKIILFKIRIKSSFKDFPLDHRKCHLLILHFQKQNPVSPRPLQPIRCI